MSLKGEEDKGPGTKFFIEYGQISTNCNDKDTFPRSTLDYLLHCYLKYILKYSDCSFQL